MEIPTPTWGGAHMTKVIYIYIPHIEVAVRCEVPLTKWQLAMSTARGLVAVYRQGERPWDPNKIVLVVLKWYTWMWKYVPQNPNAHGCC